MSARTVVDGCSLIRRDFLRHRGVLRVAPRTAPHRTVTTTTCHGGGGSSRPDREPFADRPDLLDDHDRSGLFPGPHRTVAADGGAVLYRHRGVVLEFLGLREKR